jgi:PAS domain S-box-containing protein
MTDFLQKAIVSISDLGGTEDLPLFRRLMESINQGVLIVDLDQKIIYANANFCELVGYEAEELTGEYAPKALLGVDWSEIMNARIEDRKNRKSESYQILVNHKNGSQKWMQVNAAPIIDTNDKVVGSIGLHADVTEKIEQDKALKKALQEKELLLQETHHRVKNNLQIISSLMNLQSTMLSEESDIETAFAKCRSRINAMASLHEIVYKSGESGKINFREYCGSLIQQIRQVLAVKEQNITINADIELRLLSVDDALSCGMYINELISNSVEHAFSETGGTINLRVSKKTNQTVIEISDNGKGLPADFDIETTNSLGMQLVSSFAEKLNGILEINGDDGSRFSLSFEPKSEN